MANVDLEEIAVSLLGAVDGVNIGDTATSETIYTVPPGKVCILDHIIIRNLSATAASAVVSVGQLGALTDFLPNQTITALNSTNSVGILRPVPNATTVKHIQYSAGTLIKLDVATASTGACTARVEAWGKLADA